MINGIQSSAIKLKYNKKQTEKPAFRGLGTAAVGALRFLDNSPAIGACAVDLGSMVIPRTIVDTKNRGADAGVETGIREASSTINHAAVGMVGMAAATAISKGVNSKYGVKANKIFANGDSIDVLSNIWKKTGNKKDYFKTILENIEGLGGKKWVDLKSIEDLSLDDLANQMIQAEGSKDLRKIISNKITGLTGAKGSFRLNDAVSNKTINDSLDTLLENATDLGKAFEKAGQKNLDNFVKDLKNIRVKSALMGLGTAALIGCCIQPVNKYLTKKRTGSDGFVGVQGREADKSLKFKLQKAGMAGIMGAFALKTIGGSPSQILNKIQFNSKIPNLNQFKLLYGLTIMSRLLSSRDKNELRESSIKDFLGFSNWLILGGMVSKLVARFIPGGKDLINYAAETAPKKPIKHVIDWITKAKVKGYDEILLKNASKVVDNNGKALGFTKLMSMADKATKLKVGKVALAQVAGYLYSGIVLGIGIAKLNIFITNKIEKNTKKDLNNNSPEVKYFAQNNIAAAKVFNNIKTIF